MRNWDQDTLEEYYAEYLEENCDCDIDEDGCSCKSFTDWFSDMVEAVCDYYSDEESA